MRWPFSALPAKSCRRSAVRGGVEGLSRRSCGDAGAGAHRVVAARAWRRADGAACRTCCCCAIRGGRARSCSRRSWRASRSAAAWWRGSRRASANLNARAKARGRCGCERSGSVRRVRLAPGVLALERAEYRLIGRRYKLPKLVSEQIAASRRFRDGVAEVAQKLKRSEDSVAKEAVGYLHELRTAHSPFAIDVMMQIARGLVHARVWRAYRLRPGADRADARGVGAGAGDHSAQPQVEFGFGGDVGRVRGQSAGDADDVRRHQHGLLADGHDRAQGGARVHPARRRRTTPSTSSCCASIWVISSRSGSVSSGTSKAGGRAPASSCRRSLGCSPISCRRIARGASTI